jgi:hypothetical protein
VSPLITVSLGWFCSPELPLSTGCREVSCRTTKVKLKVSSSSLVRRRRKVGVADEAESGSYENVSKRVLVGEICARILI